MRNLRAFWLPVGFLAMAALYAFAFATIGVQLLRPQPDWWDFGASRVATGVGWMLANHWFGLVAASLPFAVAIRCAGVRRPVLLALGLAVAALVVPNVWLSWPVFGLSSSLVRMMLVVDVLKFLVTLPLCTWLLSRWKPGTPWRQAVL